MALITSFEDRSISSSQRGRSAECGSRVFETPVGRLIQFDAYGSAQREFEDTVSQPSQLDDKRLVGYCRSSGAPSLICDAVLS